jgi:hypothetical protein
MYPIREEAELATEPFRFIHTIPDQIDFACQNSSPKSCYWFKEGGARSSESWFVMIIWTWRSPQLTFDLSASCNFLASSGVTTSHEYTDLILLTSVCTLLL